MLSVGSAIFCLELFLPLPSLREVWFADSSENWEQLALEKPLDNMGCAPSLIGYLADASKLYSLSVLYDSEFTNAASLYAMWRLVRHFQNWYATFVGHELST